MADEFMKAALYGIKTFNKKVKEKIGIMKLIYLLNEYETPRSGVVYKSYDDYDGFFYGVDIDGETEIVWSDSLICSKKFGFIKWLVENEKIEENSDFITLASELGCAFSSDVLLMYLAIQDEPIKFLLEILK